MIQANENDVRRFMSYVEVLQFGCWHWTGARSRGRGNRKWYGSFSIGKKTVRAHRFSAEVIGGKQCPAGHHRDHVCNFSLCVNPDHIEIVTREENERRKQQRKQNAITTIRKVLTNVDAGHERNEPAANAECISASLGAGNRGHAEA